VSNNIRDINCSNRQQTNKQQQQKFKQQEIKRDEIVDLNRPMEKEGGKGDKLVATIVLQASPKGCQFFTGNIHEKDFLLCHLSSLEFNCFLISPLQSPIENKYIDLLLFAPQCVCHFIYGMSEHIHTNRHAHY